MELSNKSKRLVNIEMLRIVSMLFVLLVHYNIPVNGQLTCYEAHNEPFFFVGKSFVCALDFVCVNCFVLISGYFGIKWKWKGLFNFLFQIAFWGGLIYCVCYVLGYYDFSTIGFAKNTICFWSVNWFFTAYLALYMFAPVLNVFLNNSTEKQIGQVVLVFYVFQTIFGYILKSNPEFNQGLTSCSFFGLYLLGGYLRRSNAKVFSYGPAMNFGVYFGIAVMCVVLSFITKYIGFGKDVYSYISPLQIIQTIYLFLAFKSLKVHRGEKIILFFSSSAFAGLLMHSWQGGNLYHDALFWIDKNVPVPFVMPIVFIVLFFAVACCIDKIRIFIWNKLLVNFL